MSRALAPSTLEFLPLPPAQGSGVEVSAAASVQGQTWVRSRSRGELGLSDPGLGA